MSSVAPQEQGSVLTPIMTLVFFAIITVLIYYVLLKPILSPGDAPNNEGGRAMHRGGVVPPQRQPRRRVIDLTQQQDDDGALSPGVAGKSMRCPPHVAPGSARHAGSGGSGLLVEGLVPFRHARASSYEQGLAANVDPDVVSKNRRERARVLARLLALNTSDSAAAASGVSLSSPPARGSTVVVSVPREDVGCPKLRRILFLLATYYNAFVIVSFSSNDNYDRNQLSALIAKLRGDVATELPPEVLPDHRIVAAQSITGRVAFVRQLARVEFVLDFDPEVQKQLGRFGFRVFVYGATQSDSDGASSSRLGNALLP